MSCTGSNVFEIRKMYFWIPISSGAMSNFLWFSTGSDPKVIKLFLCSTQLSMKFVLLINLKLLTILNSFLLNIAEHENFSANTYENANFSWHFHMY